MKLGVIEAPTIHELFINKIVGLVLSGRLAVGDKLPTEREMALETKISKTAVNGAMKELERLGFIETIPRQGTFVANYSEKGTLETLNVIMKYNGGNLTKEQTNSLFETRMAVEGWALKNLCEKSDPEAIASLENLIEGVEALNLQDTPHHVTIMVEKLFAFHHEICKLSGNLLFPLILNAFKPMTLAFWEIAIRAKGIELTIKGMRQYVEAIRKGDSLGAQAILKRDLDICLDQLP